MRVAESRLADIGQDEAIAAAAAGAVRSEAPSKSGRLRGSVRVAPVDGVPGVVVGVVYAGPINYGWPARGIDPAEYLERGAVAAEPAVEKVLETRARLILANVKGA